MRAVVFTLTAALFAIALMTTAARAASGDEALVTHVLNRLAYGPRPGDVERVRRIGVDAWIDEQLHPERIAMPPDLVARLGTIDVLSLPAGTLIDGYREEQRAVRLSRRVAAEAEVRAGAPQDMNQASGDAARERVVARRREEYRRLAQQSYEARLAQAIDSPRQLEEVMTDFWFNHFNVFIGKGLDRVLVASYEREAIRPHALGRFRDLLGATAKHPAMLFYLDNWLSTGTDAAVNRDARAGTSPILGLNENYARELMELHTLGVENEGKPGGYRQEDVTELARMLTGWTFDGRATGRGGPLAGRDGPALFAFAPRRHDDGPKAWLGRSIAPAGVQEGETALDVLAVHPSTARHIAFKLVQAFVADVPPPPLVDRVAARFTATDGDIRETLHMLFASAEFRDPRTMNGKFKTPYRFVVSAMRASGVGVADTRPLAGALAQMGMPLYGCQTPDGYRNTQEAWLNPEGMTRRIGFATALATGGLPIDRDALAVASTTASSAIRPSGARGKPLPVLPLLETLGPAIGERTRGVVLGSEPRLAAALVLGSPDFMRH